MKSSSRFMRPLLNRDENLVAIHEPLLDHDENLIALYEMGVPHDVQRVFTHAQVRDASSAFPRTHPKKLSDRSDFPSPYATVQTPFRSPFRRSPNSPL